LRFRRETRLGKTTDERSPGVLRVVPCLDVHLASREEVERIVVHFLVDAILGERGEERNGLLLPIQVPVRLRQTETDARRDRRILLVSDRLLECARRLLPTLDAHFVHPLLVGLARELVARALDRIRERGEFRLAEWLVLHSRAS